MANPERTNIPLGGEYQVFLNFRGCDIRHGFADTLYHFLDNAGIHIFMDDAEIRPGEIIADRLLQAINDSKLYIPIFSPEYASSHWCLIELAKMMENISKSKEHESKKVIMPIFYDVEPEDLKLGKLDKPLYRDAILKLEEKKVNQEKKFTTEDVDRWRKALSEVDASKGLKRKDHSGDGHLSKSVVEEVLHRLWIKRRIVTKDLVGMKDRIAVINNLLGIDSDGEYQVFLSFSEPDTLHGFTDTLYHALDDAGIHVFTKYEELGEGKTIGDSLLRVIDDSKFYIPIFSKNYAASHWCLKELKRMVENTFKSKEDGDEKVILPIFYDVGPSDVKLETKLYHDAILNLEKSHSSDDVEAWRQALRKVADIRGWYLKNYTG